MILSGDRGIVRLLCFLLPVFLPSQITSCKFPSSACHVLLFFLLLISFRISMIFCLSCSAFSRWEAITSTSLLRCQCSISGWNNQVFPVRGGRRRVSSEWQLCCLRCNEQTFPPPRSIHFLEQWCYFSFTDGAVGLLALRPVRRAGYEADVCGLTYG